MKRTMLSLAMIGALSSAAQSSHAGTMIEIGSNESKAGADARVNVVADSGDTVSIEVESSAEVGVDAEGNLLIDGKLAFERGRWSVDLGATFGADGFGGSFEAEFEAHRFITLRSKFARAPGEQFGAAVGVKVTYRNATLDMEVGAQLEGGFGPMGSAELSIPVGGGFEVYVSAKKDGTDGRVTAGVRYKHKPNNK